MKPKALWSRRRFLEITGLAGGVVALRSFLDPSSAVAAPENPQLLLFVYFSGGWDQMLAFDPRDNTVYKGNKAQQTGIMPAYDLVQDPAVQALLASNPSGVQKSGSFTVGPAIPPSLFKHAADLCLVRGVSMDTLTHEVGRKYFQTGKFPRGLAPNGSSLNTVVASVPEASELVIPNMSIKIESYNEGRPAYASGVRVSTADDVLSVLSPLGKALDPASAEALEAFEAKVDNCEQHGMNGEGIVSLFRDARVRARKMTTSTAANLFKFNPAMPSKDVEDLLSKLEISTSVDLAGPKGRAAIAAQALCSNISQAVAVELCNDLDDHSDWGDVHATTLRTSFHALGLLIDYLKGQQHATGGTVWDHTTIVVFSEFARTPNLNGRDGRDHHLASSCLVGGPGLQGGIAVGATSDEKMAVMKMNLDTGAPVPSDDPLGTTVHPSDVHATVLESMGLSYDHLSNQSPKLIPAILKK